MKEEEEEEAVEEEVSNLNSFLIIQVNVLIINNDFN